MTTFNLTCEAVEATLADYLDETLEPWVRESIEAHLGECDRCATLARELRNITRETATLPALLPEGDIWSRVAGRIGAPVRIPEPLADSKPIPPTPEPIVSTSAASLPVSERPPVAIESSLATAEPELATSEPPMRTREPPVLRTDDLNVPTSDGPPVLPIPVYGFPSPTEESVEQPGVLTGDISPPASELEVPVMEPLPQPAAEPVPAPAPSHALARRRKIRWGPAQVGMAAAALVVVTAGTTSLLTVKWLERARPSNVATDAGTRRASPSEKAPSSLGTRERGAGRGEVAFDSSAGTLSPGPPASALAVSATSAPAVARSPEDVVYDKEINTLQRIVRRQKPGLDTSTVVVIEKNLRSVDAAIAQIRAALKKDPGSSLLDGQASRALEMKVELLRRAAMLQSNT